MQFKNNTKRGNVTIQGLRSFKDTLPKNVKKIINKKGHIYSETLGNWRYIVGDDLFKVCYPKTFKNSNKFGVSTLIVMVKRGHEVDMEYSKKDILDDPDMAVAYAYDVVLNGYEIGGGSLRIYDKSMQETIFSILNISKEEADNKFGFLLKALSTGCPPHGGIAFGLDRIVMLVTDTTNIRDVIAFPKTQSAACLLTNAPSKVEKEQLDELKITSTHKEE